MKCPKCGTTKLKAEHTFDAGVHGSTRSSRCTKCKINFTLVIAIVVQDPGHGEGAYAMAQRLKEGKVKVGVSHPGAGRGD